MLVAKVLLPVNVLLLVSLASEARYHSRLSRDDRPSHAWERREQQDSYFEQCRFVSAWKEHLGYVSVLAFLDPTWQYSFRQAVMLQMLSSRLRKSGFPDVRFFAISPSSDSMENESSEEDLEIETWREIEAKHEMESFVNRDFLREDGSEITYLQDDPRSSLWKRFRASKDQVIIIDRCGKLTYHVIVPWSILFFPYAKAAILSTYEEDPCGGCDPTSYQTPSLEKKLTMVTAEEEANSTQSKTDANAIWTIENLENATPRHESSSSTASSISLEEINTDHPIVLTESSTESTIYRYNNDVTESRFDENRLDAEGTRDQEISTNSKSGTISSGTAATFEPQRDVFSPTQVEAPHPLVNNSLTPVNNRDRTLLLDEPEIDETESDSTPTDERTTLDLVEDRTTPEDTERFEEDAFLPLRIIMYAPHVHKNGRKMRKYTHLILKVGDPDFHEHLNFGVDVASPMDSWRVVDSHITSLEDYGWETTEANADEENENQKFSMFGANESPGLYGEIADYWKSYEDNDITDRNETFNNTYNNSTTGYDEEYRANVSDPVTSLSKPEESYSIANVAENPNVEGSTDPQEIVDSDTIESFKSTNMNNQVDKEEEAQYKLIEHYKKLLPWLNYRLNK